MLREFRDLLPAFMNFTGYRALDECPLWISFFIFQQGNSIILKADAFSRVSSIWLSLPYHYSIKNLSFHVRLSRPNRYFYPVTDFSVLLPALACLSMFYARNAYYARAAIVCCNYHAAYVKAASHAGIYGFHSNASTTFIISSSQVNFFPISDR